MATVKMRKGNVYADIYDSPETIRTAQMQGYSLIEDEPAKQEEVVESTEQEKTVVDEPAKQEEVVAETPSVEEEEETIPASKPARRRVKRD